MVTRKENYAPLHQNGVIVLLRRELSALATEGRPLSAGGTEALWQVRAPMYRAFADAEVQSQLDVSDTGKLVLEAYGI